MEHPKTIADVDPGRVYPLSAYARVMGYCQRMAQNHAKAGHLEAVRVGKRGEYRLLGVGIIRAGCGHLPQPSETAAEMRARDLGGNGNGAEIGECRSHPNIGDRGRAAGQGVGERRTDPTAGEGEVTAAKRLPPQNRKAR